MIWPTARSTKKPMARHDPLPSRNGTTSPLGKLDDRIEAFKIESVVKARFEAKAAECGKPSAEFLREIMRVIAFGPDEVKRMHSDGVDRVVRLLGGKSGGTE